MPSPSTTKTTTWGSVLHDDRDILRTSAESGARLLDAEYPGWYHVVDPAKVDAMSLRNCVVSHLFRSYKRGLESLGISPSSEVAASQLGFTLPPRLSNTLEMHEHAAVLSAAWAELIQIRLEQDPLD